MIENCSECGNKLEDNVKFCPDCGKQVIQKAEIKNEETEKELEKRSQKIRLNLPKISIKNSPKPVLAGIVLFVIAIVAIASVLIISPINLSGSVTNSDGYKIGERVFSINIENTCDEKATCYLTVDGLRYTHIGTVGEFTVNSGETFDVSIVEEALFKKCESYEISLFVEFDHLEKATIYDVTQNINFVIVPLEDEGEFSIESNILT